MAFTGVSERKIVFRNGDLIKYNLQPFQFLSGFMKELLERDHSAQSVVYTFPQLTIQEFVAALAHFLALDLRDIRKLLREAHSKQDGRFEIFLRFVAGFSSPHSARPLKEFLGPFLHQTTCRVIDWVKEKGEGQIGNTESETGKRSLLNTFHYLFESQNNGLALDTVGSVAALTFSGLGLNPIDCAVLSHVIGLCDTIKHLDLQNCNIQGEVLQLIGPVLHKCRVLKLGSNKLGETGVKLLSAALRNSDCKIQKLGLDDNDLTASSAERLASALSPNRSLTVLNLNNNKLGDSGVKQLCAPLRNLDCKIRKLRLRDVDLTNSFAENLVSAISITCSLTELNLCNNKLGDSGVKILCAVLRNPDCKIQKLCLTGVGLTGSCAKDLFSNLSKNWSLTVLDLGTNKLGDSGVKIFSAALRNPDCKIQCLRLYDKGLSASGVKDLTSTLSTNRSLKELDLGCNKLRDSGAKLLAAALEDQKCKIESLKLDDARHTDSCVEDLTSALSTNRSLKVLNLELNSFTDQSVPTLRRIVLDCRSLERIVLWKNRFSSNGEKQLKSLQGTRRRLIVEV